MIPPHLRRIEVRDVVDGPGVLASLGQIPFDPHPQARVSLDLKLGSRALADYRISPGFSLFPLTSP